MNLGRLVDCARFVAFAPLELALVLFPSAAEVRAWSIAKFEEERVAAEQGSAATGPGTESDGVSTTAPVPGQPDQRPSESVPLLIEEHYISGFIFTGSDFHADCHCRKWSGPIAAHADHIADVVRGLPAKPRIKLLFSRFRK